MHGLEAITDQLEGLAQPRFQCRMELLVYGLAHELEALLVGDLQVAHLLLQRLAAGLGVVLQRLAELVDALDHQSQAVAHVLGQRFSGPPILDAAIERGLDQLLADVAQVLGHGLLQIGEGLGLERERGLDQRLLMQEAGVDRLTDLLQRRAVTLQGLLQ